MSINAELSVLYRGWQEKNAGHFVAGGVVDESCYRNSQVKVLFLLKEVNDTEQKEDWSLVQLMHDQFKQERYFRIWEIIGTWSYALKKGLPFYHELLPRNKEQVWQGLSAIAMTNLKKTGGGGQSDSSEIREHAFQNKDLWLKEIDIINPDLIICGGTFPVVHEALGFEIAECASGAKIGKYDGRLFLDFNHPMYRISPKIFYAYFKETMKALGY